jgi:hypothetical protein
VLVFVAILGVDLLSGHSGQCALDPALPFHTTIGLTWEVSGSLRQPSDLVKSVVVEFPLIFPSSLSNPMTAVQAPVRPSSPIKLDSKRGMLDCSLLIIEGALAFDLVSVP